MATQSERVLSMLRVAGKQGIRSDQFFHCGMPRGAARIRDLKDEGVDIESVREGKYTRYTLKGNVGASAGSARDELAAGFDPSPASPDASVRSGVETTPCPPELAPPERSVPSMFDAEDFLSWGDAA